MEIYSVLEKKEILMHAVTQMIFEDIIPSEINQSQNDKYCVIPLRWDFNVVRFIETK